MGRFGNKVRITRKDRNASTGGAGGVGCGPVSIERTLRCWGYLRIFPGVHESLVVISWPQYRSQGAHVPGIVRAESESALTSEKKTSKIVAAVEEGVLTSVIAPDVDKGTPSSGIVRAESLLISARRASKTIAAAEEGVLTSAVRRAEGMASERQKLVRWSERSFPKLVECCTKEKIWRNSSER